MIASSSTPISFIGLITGIIFLFTNFMPLLGLTLIIIAVLHALLSIVLRRPGQTSTAMALILVGILLLIFGALLLMAVSRFIPTI